ncbi:type II toxin-antitoxin system HicA family toxin [Desulfosarcina sp. OttesenSCG-928-G10]|nr:type II toxin-antitoxin system HicA family toxin [Desulfosarcina sp. OttesenSCG-928-G10]
MHSRDIIRLLETDGWVHVKTVGDHFQFRHPKRPGKVTVPHPKKDIPIGTLASIEKQSGLHLRARD